MCPAEIFNHDLLTIECTNDYYYGSICRAACPKNFRVIHSNRHETFNEISTECGPDSKWDHQISGCELITCPFSIESFDIVINIIFNFRFKFFVNQYFFRKHKKILKCK